MVVMKLHEFLADFILYFHLLYVLGVLVPIPLIALGFWHGWKWVRRPWLRNIHVGMILFVVFEVFVGMICPLTEWEAALRARSPGENLYPEGFMAAWISKILFSDFEPWVYVIMYITTALIIIDLYILVPPEKN